MKKNIQHFVVLTALAAGTIHFVNRFIDITSEMKNILNPDNGNFFDWKNGKNLLHQTWNRNSSIIDSRS